ncbi:hypothetical protein LVB87_15250 [Lysobacter sp. KIS68-7]|uniref:hypothetical protein n=1 Tax=Lysobacter sp. KIS68-7 TaxID=2904252 RepID=UPI001E61DCF1|nr:hypothetical protein [Lysobacter sp. KIS68-7]UHQ19523.1 hypothetical protein LVB87_15250 [Lysobacter sp. KIS68-7]
MRLLPSVFAAIAACSFFPAAHAACTPASIAGWFAGGGAGAYYADPDPVVGVVRIGFDGVNGVSVQNYREGQTGAVTTFTGTGTYSLDSWCRGSATISLKQGTVAAGTVTVSFVVAGTQANPLITGIVSNPAAGSTGALYLAKIGL